METSIWKKTSDVAEKQGGKPVREIHGIDTFDWTKTRAQRIYNQQERELHMKDGEGSHYLAKQADSLLTEFEGYAKNRDLIRVKFDTCDLDGNFTAMTPEGVLFVLPGENFSKVGINLDKYKASKMLGVDFDLYVETVDREKRQIVMQRATPQSTRTVLLRELRRSFEKGEKPLVIGRIIEVHDNYALVDVLNSGVTASIGANRWRRGFTRSLSAIIRPDQFFRFTVNDIKKDDKSGKELIYLSRRDLDEDGWDNLDFTDIDIDSAIVVECLNKPSGKNYFWGASDRLPGAELTCEYTERFRKGSLDVMEGIRYICKVKKIEDGRGENAGKRCIVVIPFRVYPDDAAKLAAVKNIRSKEPLTIDSFYETLQKDVTAMKNNNEAEMSGGQNE